MARIALIATDPLYASWLADVLGEEVELHWLRPDDPDDPVLSQLERLAVLEAVLVEPKAELIREISDAQDAVVIGVCMDNPGNDAITLIRAGATDLFVMGRDDQAIASRLDTLLRDRLHRAPVTSTDPGERRQSQVLTLLGPGGHGDLSFCAVHLAMALLQLVRPGERVLVLDLAIPYGSALVHLDLNQSYSVLDAVGDTYRCDASLIDSAFARHGDGVYLLTVPEDQVGPVRIGDAELAALLKVLRPHFRYTVCTVSSTLSVAIARTLLEESSQAAMVSDGSIVNSRATRALLHALRREDVSLSHLGLICDAGRGIHALDAANLSRLLELPLWAELRGSAQLREKAINQGAPLFSVAPRDPTCKGLTQLAQRLHQGQLQAAQEPAAGGFLQRLFAG